MYPQTRALNINGFHLYVLIHLVVRKEVDASTYTHKRNEITEEETMPRHITTIIPQNATKPWFISLPNCRSDLQ